jgi:hypothetical protein
VRTITDTLRPRGALPYASELAGSKAMTSPVSRARTTSWIVLVLRVVDAAVRMRAAP